MSAAADRDPYRWPSRRRWQARGKPRADTNLTEQAGEHELDEDTASDLAGRLKIRDNPVSRSYDAVLDGTVVTMIVCEDDGTRRAFDHTVVDPEHRGRGITTMLVKAALEDFRAKELTLTNYCRFVAGFIVGHPD